MELPESSSILELFWGLSSVDEEERIKNAQRLVLGVKNLQGSEEDVDSTVQYCLQRLVRGLASNRKGARHGFFVALCELLSVRQGEDVREVISLIAKHLEQTGNAKAQEQRGAHFGLAFALLSFIQSDVLKEPDAVAAVTEKLAAMAGKKAYLAEFAGVALAKLIGGVPEEVVLSHVLDRLGLECGWEGCSPDKLLVLAELQRTVGKTERYRQLLCKFWGCKRIHSPGNFRAMADVLMQSSDSLPRIHAVWPAMLEIVKPRHFPNFWTATVDGCLLASTHQRKYLTFKLVELLMPTVTMSQVGVVLSPSLLRCLMTNASSPSNLLHKAAIRLLHVLEEGVSESCDPGLVVAVTLQLLEVGVSDPKTGSVPGSDVLRQLTEKVTSAGIESYVQQAVGEAGMVSAERVQLLLKHFARHKSVGWLLPLGKNLLLLSQFLQVKRVPPLVMAIPDDHLIDRHKLSQKLVAILTHLSSLRRGGEEDGTTGEWFVSMVTYAQELFEAGKDVAVHLYPFVEEQHRSVWQEAMSLVVSLASKDDLSIKEKVFQPLVCTASLQLLIEAHPESRSGVADIIKELLACHADMTSTVLRTPGKKRGRGRGGVSTMQRTWVEVLVDLMLSLLSRPQQLWRNVVDRTFPVLLPCLTKEAVELIIKALEPEAVDDLMETGEDQSHQESDKDDSTDDEQTQFHDVDAEFRAEVRRALGSLAVSTSDQESIADSSLDDEQMMAVDDALGEVFRRRLEDTPTSRKKQQKSDDETVMHFRMRVLDLVEVFIRRGSRNPLVLELMQPLLKLARHAQSKKTQAALAGKLAVVLHTFTHMKTYPRDGVDVSHLHDFLESTLQDLQRVTRFTSPMVTDACLFLVRVLRGSQPLPSVSPMATRSARKRRLSERKRVTSAQFGALDVDKVSGWLSTTLEHMITNKNSAIPLSFFESLSLRQPELSWQLFPALVTCLPSAGNHYRKLQAFQLATNLLSLKGLPDEVVVSTLSTFASDLQQACLDDLRSATDRPTPAKEAKSKRSKPTLILLDKLIGKLYSHEKLQGFIHNEELLVCLDELELGNLLAYRHLKDVLLENNIDNKAEKKWRFEEST